ncbi:MAG: toll/interleukin-1 receptor domain-containing protein [Candidatus Cloacimonetes bacterium]|nr:toll/interleukin-1 receptor domain-containing protein [Candidatus Cloacimonadota bacterium]MDY0230285.1 toll/interleukin-1 receptor domain-containing protein [Candidatus Cloacimonadaceae bacterium]
MIFVSHAWLNGKPDQRIIEFVNFLRDNGYEAECDVMHMQQKSATHFIEMMANALRSAEKIIIVLSENYKERAEEFKGGVGIEYKYIIDDFSRNENKYILASFMGRCDNITPDFLKGREIVDLSIDRDNQYRELFFKLSSAEKYKFSEVATEKTVPKPEVIGKFEPIQKESHSKKYNIDISPKQVYTDVDKKKFLEESFKKIVEALTDVSAEFCEQFPNFQIERDEIDLITFVFEVYKSGSRIHGLQIWFGSFNGGREKNILIGYDIGRKNSYSEIISCEEYEGRLDLNFQMGFLMDKKNLNFEEAVRMIWEKHFKPYFRMESNYVVL